jgi:uncharacterized protein (TIGR02444 family)
MPASLDDFSLDGPHWTFALDFYRKPGVAQACLTLQDKLGLNVIMLLFALYLFDRHRYALGTDEIARLEQTVAVWRRDIVVPLRAIRRSLKAQPILTPISVKDQLLGKIEELSIFSEQIELAIMANSLNSTQGCGEVGDLSKVLDRVVSFYSSESLTESNSEAVAAVETLLAAAASLVERKS